jgi:uncharacterized membrane protein YgdD (TMEM256/DUF423 family)
VARQGESNGFMHSTVVKLFFGVAGLSGACGIALGALTAHGLSQHLQADALATLDMVSKYLLVHGLLLFAIATSSRTLASSTILTIAGLLVVVGIFLFCGGLMLSKLSGVRQFGLAAPLGGLAFIAGWLACAAHGVFHR